MNVESLSMEEINALNKKEMEDAQADFNVFKNDIQAGTCPICGEKISVFDEKIPCMHWLLMPKGFKKKHFHLVYENFNLFRIDAFLRWLVHIEAPFRNVNDLSEERGRNKIIETTIKYKNLEWSISCSAGDFQGHDNHGSHYHFQMRIEQRSFIDYANFHIPLTVGDINTVNILQGNVAKVKHVNLFGMGVEEAMGYADENPEDLMNGMKPTDDPAKSTFGLTTILMAEPGKLISGDDLYNIIKKSKETGTTFAKLAGEIKNAKASTIIYPGEGIPKKAGRKNKKRR